MPVVARSICRTALRRAVPPTSQVCRELSAAPGAGRDRSIYRDVWVRNSRPSGALSCARQALAPERSPFGKQLVLATTRAYAPAVEDLPREAKRWRSVTLPAGPVRSAPSSRLDDAGTSVDRACSDADDAGPLIVGIAMLTPALVVLAAHPAPVRGYELESATVDAADSMGHAVHLLPGVAVDPRRLTPPGVTFYPLILPLSPTRHALMGA